MRSKKKFVWLFVCVLMLGALALSWQRVLFYGVDIALHHLMPSASCAYDSVTWKQGHLIVEHLVIRDEGYEAIIESAEVGGTYSLFPSYIEPHILLTNLELQIKESNAAMEPVSFFALLFPTEQRRVKIDIPSALLNFKDQKLFFSFQSGDTKEKIGALAVSYDPSVATSSFLSLDLRHQENEIEMDFALQEMECAHLVHLLSLMSPSLRQGWEHLEGIIQATGKVNLFHNFSLRDCSFDVDVKELKLENLSLGIDVQADHFLAEISYPSSVQPENQSSPFWKQWMAQLFLEKGKLFFPKYQGECSLGIAVETAHLQLDPHTDPSFYLLGALMDQEQQYPLEVLGKGYLHEDKSFWLELSADFSEGDQLFFSLCGLKEQSYVFVADVARLGSKNLQMLSSFVMPLECTISASSMSGKYLAWIENNALERIEIEGLSIEHATFHRPFGVSGISDLIQGGGRFQKDAQGKWVLAEAQGTLKALQLIDAQGAKLLESDGCFSIVQNQLQAPSSFKGYFKELSGEIQLTGPLSEPLAEMTFSTSQRQLLDLCGMQQVSLEGEGLPIVMHAHLAKRKGIWAIAGELTTEKEGQVHFDVSDPLGQREGQTSGWFRAEAITNSVLKPFFSSMTPGISFEGTLDCEGSFDEKQMTCLFTNGGYRLFWQEHSFEIEKEAALFYDRMTQQWRAKLPFCGASIKEVVAPLTLQGEIEAEGVGDQWTLKAHIGDLSYPLHANLLLKQCTAELSFDPSANHLLLQKAKGVLYNSEIGELSLLVDHCLLSLKEEEESSFDFALIKEDEIARLVGLGKQNGSQFFLTLDPQQSHFLGAHPERVRLTLDREGILSVDLKMHSKDLKHHVELLTERKGKVWNTEKLLLDDVSVKGDLIVQGDEYVIPRIEITRKEGFFKGEAICRRNEQGVVGEFLKGEGHFSIASTGTFQLTKPTFFSLNWQGEIDIADLNLHLQPSGLPVADIYRNNLKDRNFDKEAPQNACPERAAIAGRQDASEGKRFEVKPLLSKTDSSGFFGITIPRLFFSPLEEKMTAKQLKFSLPVEWVPVPVTPSLKGSAEVEISRKAVYFEGTLEGCSIELFETQFPLEQTRFSFASDIWNVSSDTMYQQHPLHITLGLDTKEKSSLLVKLQDVESKEELHIYACQDSLGYSLESVEGSLFGLEASLAKNDDALEGKLKINGDRLFSLLPLGEQVSKTGQWEMTGRWKVPVAKTEKASFTGRVNGENVALFGYRFSECAAALDMSLPSVKISEFILIDPAVEMTIPQIKAVYGESFSFEIPLVQLRDFNPSKLRPLSGDSPKEKPFILTHVSLMDLRGSLDDPATLTGLGLAHFKNVEKKREGFLEASLDLIKKWGLDPGIFTPQSGEIELRWEGKRIYLTGLKKSYSEGRRSHFTLDTTSGSSYFTLQGDLKIDLKMQTELPIELPGPLAIKVRGSLSAPRYHFFE